MDQRTLEAVTAGTTVATAIGTLISVYVAYRGIRSQARNFRNSVSADLALKLCSDFDEKDNLARRSRVAHALINEIPLVECDDLFDKFEAIGLFYRKGLIDADVAYSFFFHWVNIYWVAGKHIIESKRKSSENLWCDFEYLYDALLKIEIKNAPHSRLINPSEQLIKQLLEEEL